MIKGKTWLKQCQINTVAMESTGVYWIAHFQVLEEARIDGQTVVVWSEEVALPVAVRHGWSDSLDINLYNKEGLPASPFRTDSSP